MAAAKKKDSVHPHRVMAFVDIDVMGLALEEVEAAYPDHDVDCFRVDLDRLFDIEYPDGDTWPIPVSFDLIEK